MKIAMLMSGGVDSSVSAQLLYNNGYDFEPYYIKISMEGFDDEFSCSQEEDIEMASAVCRKLGKKLAIIDLHSEYWNNVVGYHLDRVKRGLTPNPDVMCNRLIKFGAFNDKTNGEYDKIVTGHYAQTVDDEDNKTWLMSAPDPIKDQTDFLANMTQAQLAKAWFPIGGLMKNEVRDLASKYNLAPKNRKDSQGICFLGKLNYNEFIKKYLGTEVGAIVEYETGKILGRHQGCWFHTIGQRKGLGLSGGPWFVCKKHIDSNTVFVTKNSNLFNMFAPVINLGLVDNVNWCTENIMANTKSFDVTFKIRHTPELAKGTLILSNNNLTLNVDPNTPVNGIAPGQFCTIYDETHEICFGCAEIQL